MADIKNSGFVGSSILEVEPDSYTGEFTVYNSIGDSSYINDVATGGDALHIDHTGAGKGPPLGIPLCNQILGGSGALNRGWGTTASNASDWYLWIAPIFLPDGETWFRVDLKTNESEDLELRLFNVSGVLIDRGQMSRTPGNQLTTGWLDGLTGDTPYVLGIAYLKGIFLYDTHYSKSISITFPRQASRRNQPSLDPIRQGTNYTVPTQSISPSGLGHKFTEIDASIVDEDLPITSYHLTTVNQNQNGLHEFITASPAGTNAALTLSAGGSGGQPFMDHGKADNSNGHEIQFPVMTVGLGNVNDVFTAIVAGTQSEPPGLTGSGVISNQLFYVASARLPSFPNGADSNLRAIFQVCSTSSSTCQLTIRIIAKNLATSTKTASTAVVTTDPAGGFQLTSVASFTSIDFWPGELNRFLIDVSTDSSNKGSGDIRILGFHFWFQP